MNPKILFLNLVLFLSAIHGVGGVDYPLEQVPSVNIVAQVEDSEKPVQFQKQKLNHCLVNPYQFPSKKFLAQDELRHFKNRVQSSLKEQAFLPFPTRQHILAKRHRSSNSTKLEEDILVLT